MILPVMVAATATRLSAQDEGFVYGKVTTDDGKTYQGAIRWGKEELYWSDLFNASKELNENLDFMSHDDRERLDDDQLTWYSYRNDWLGNQFWSSEKNDNDYLHQFACQFGEIKSLRPTGSQSVEVELRNGKRFKLEGEGYNDVGLDIRILDKEVGEVDVYWQRIDKVEFMDTPARLENKFGEPLYGTVEAYGRTFTGYIQWDHDERVSDDKLDGDADDGKLSIALGKIKSIERKGSRSFVVLKSGREVWMYGTNDVSNGHRGVIVMNKDFPAIDIPWDEFDKVVFEEKPSNGLTTYADFKNQNELSGVVTTHDGKSLSGKLVYDLDETFAFELLQGKEGEFEFTTPFRNIKKITTRGSHRCEIELTNGKRITLDEGQDVSERNQGILVFANNEKTPSYIRWNDVSEIEFR